MDDQKRRRVQARKLRALAKAISDNKAGALTLDALGDIFGNEFWILLLDRGPTAADQFAAAALNALLIVNRDKFQGLSVEDLARSIRKSVRAAQLAGGPGDA